MTRERVDAVSDRFVVTMPSRRALEPIVVIHRHENIVTDSCGR